MFSAPGDNMSILGDVMSTPNGYHDECGGDIMSTLRCVQYTKVSVQIQSHF